MSVGRIRKCIKCNCDCEHEYRYVGKHDDVQFREDKCPECGWSDDYITWRRLG